MARKRSNVECPVTLLTDKEFDALTIKENKTSFLTSLRNVSSNTGFSARRIREDMARKIEKDEPTKSELDIFTLDIPERQDYIDDISWAEMLNRFDELSPIEDITDAERNTYRRRTDGDKFDDMFKKEHSMLNDVLGDIQKRSKLINTKINNMSGKSSYGVNKAYVELVEAGTSMDTAKLQVIKAMADLKKTAADLRMKDQKNNPDSGVTETNDSVADRFYKSIIGGGAKRFLDSSTQYYHNVGYDDSPQTQFNVSQPIVFNGSNSTVAPSDADAYGYIKHEDRGVDICLHRYPDGRLEFVALDEHGSIVHDYELPYDELLDTIDIKPMAKYGYDKYQRKYRIVDADDINFDDSRYDRMDNDDKYDYD